MTMRGRVTQSGPSWTLDVRTWFYPALGHLGHWIWKTLSDKSASWILNRGVVMTFHIPYPGICIHIFLLCITPYWNVIGIKLKLKMMKFENIWYDKFWHLSISFQSKLFEVFTR